MSFSTATAVVEMQSRFLAALEMTNVKDRVSPRFCVQPLAPNP
jgi:hypothetical protein